MHHSKTLLSLSPHNVTKNPHQTPVHVCNINLYGHLHILPCIIIRHNHNQLSHHASTKAPHKTEKYPLRLHHTPIDQNLPHCPHAPHDTSQACNPPSCTPSKKRPLLPSPCTTMPPIQRHECTSLFLMVPCLAPPLLLVK